jgi:hypothetical protein
MAIALITGSTFERTLNPQQEAVYEFINRWRKYC